MTRERLSLYDTTLRDGAQTHGVDFSVEDKWLIAQQLDVLGIDYIEGGYPGANPTDTRLFAETRELGSARLTAFGMTKRPGRSLANDPGFQALLAAKTHAICLVAKTWDFHVDVALGITQDENVEGIRELVAAVVASGREALLDCEHFFDGYKANRRLRARAAPRRPTRPAPAGSCCAIPMAARCPKRSRGSSARW